MTNPSPDLDLKLGIAEHAVEFVARWAWRDSTISDGERLSAIKFHPVIKAAWDGLPSPDTSAVEVVAWRWRAALCPWHVVSTEHETRGAYEVEPLVPKSALDASRAETAAANARAEALVAALKPFARAATDIERVYGDVPDHQLQFLPLAMSEFRAARRALTEIEGKSP